MTYPAKLVVTSEANKVSNTLAAALRRRRRGRAPARQDAAAGHGARADDDSRQSAGAYLRRTAGRDDPLDWARDGRCRGPLVAHDPAHLGGAPAATASTANLQSTATSMNITAIQSPSSGPSPHATSSQSSACTFRLSRCTSLEKPDDSRSQTWSIGGVPALAGQRRVPLRE